MNGRPNVEHPRAIVATDKLHYGILSALHGATSREASPPPEIHTVSGRAGKFALLGRIWRGRLRFLGSDP